MNIKNFLSKLFNRSATRVSCPKCKDVHELSVDSVCPKCGTKYKVDSKYIEALKKKEAAKSASDRRVARIMAFFGRIHSSSKKSLEISKRNAGIIRIISISFLLIVLCGFFILGTALLFGDKEPLHFKYSERENQPMFFNDTDGILHYLFPDGKSGNIGIGEIGEYSSSANGKTVYFSFKGLLSPTDNYQGNEAPSNFVMRLTDGNSLSIVKESAEILPEFIAAGDCEYLYIKVSDATNPKFGTLFLSVKGEERVISEDIRDVCVSPNGRYALISVEDSGGAKLMKYAMETDLLENPGVKNAYPLSIDNKGEYICYAKKTDAERLSITSERDTSSRVEVPVFNDAVFSELTFCADARSFVVEYDNKMTFYNCGTFTYSTLSAHYGSEFGYDNLSDVNLNILTLDSIPKITHTDNDSLLPYYLYDSERKSVYCLSDDKNTQVFGKLMDSLVISESGRIAFISEGKLYCGVMDTDNNKMMEMGEFGGKTLIDISPDGKLIAYSDSDGNLFTINFGKTLAEQNMGIKRGVDADTVRFSEKSDKLLLTSDGITSIINLKNGKQETVCQGLIPEAAFLIKPDLSKLIFACREAETDRVLLYSYAKGRTTLISESFNGFVKEPLEQRLDKSTTELYLIVTE